MRVFGRYLVFQAAGWVLGGIVLGAVVHFGLIPLWLGTVMLGALVVKDLVLFRYVRSAYEPGLPHGGESLLGAVARVEQPLAPEGWVRVGAERWRARIAGGDPLEAGEFVEVRGIESLVLIVEPVRVASDEAVPEIRG